VLTADAAAAGRLRGPAVDGDPGHVVIAEVESPSGAVDETPADADAEENRPRSPWRLATFLPHELVSRIRAGQTDWLAGFGG
jgi:hypothetical protein